MSQILRAAWESGRPGRQHRLELTVPLAHMPSPAVARAPRKKKKYSDLGGSARVRATATSEIGRATYLSATRFLDPPKKPRRQRDCRGRASVAAARTRRQDLPSSSRCRRGAGQCPGSRTRRQRPWRPCASRGRVGRGAGRCRRTGRCRWPRRDQRGFRRSECRSLDVGRRQRDPQIAPESSRRTDAEGRAPEDDDRDAPDDAALLAHERRSLQETLDDVDVLVRR